MDDSIYTFILRSIKWAVILLLLAPAIKYVYTAKRKTTVKLLFTIEVGIIIFSIIPFILLRNTRDSILNLALNGYFWFIVVLISYVIALIFLIFKKRVLYYLSCLLFSIGFLATWIALFKYIPASAINNDKTIGLLWIFIFLIMPFGVLLLYLNIITSYIKRKDIVFEPSKFEQVPPQKTFFKVRMSYFYYFFFGALIIFLSLALIYNTPTIIKEPSLISVLFLLIGLWAILYLISMLSSNTIFLTGQTLDIITKRWGLFSLSSRKKIELGEIENVILATGKYLRELANQTHNIELQKEIEKNSPRNFVSFDFLQFLYIIKRQGSIEFINVSHYANKKLIALAQELSKRNIKTEVHL